MKKVKILRGDNSKNFQKGVDYAAKGEQAKILNADGQVVFVIGSGTRSFEDEGPASRDSVTDSRISAWLD